MPAFLLRMRRQHVALLINKVGGSRRGLSIRLSGIFTYLACFWNQGVRIIEVLLYIHEHTPTHLVKHVLLASSLRLKQFV